MRPHSASISTPSRRCSTRSASGLVPDQSTLYTAWHERFTEEHREDLRKTVEKVVSVARAHGVAVPGHAFTTEDAGDDDDDEDRSARSERRLARRQPRRSGRQPNRWPGRSKSTTGPATPRSTTTLSSSYTLTSAVVRISMQRLVRAISSRTLRVNGRLPGRITATASATSPSNKATKPPQGDDFGHRPCSTIERTHRQADHCDRHHRRRPFLRKTRLR